MKVGDLVEVSLRNEQCASYGKHHGVVVNTWKNHKRQLQDVDVLLASGNIKNINAGACKVINESR